MSQALSVGLLGVTFGLQYGLAAMGLVLVYRMGRYVNFAQASMGLVAAALLGKLALEEGFPYWASLILALAAGVASAAIVERLLTWRLFNASRLVLLLATVGMSQLLAVVVLVIIRPNSAVTLVRGYPQPFSITWRIGSDVLNTSDILTLALAPLLAVGLHGVFGYTRLGKRVRAAASNADAARLAGISVKRVSLIVWCLAGFLSSLAAILQAPHEPSGSAVLATTSLGLLVRALAATLLAGMVDFRWALAAGLAIGILEQTMAYYVGGGGVVDLALVLAVLAGLALRRRQLATAFRRGDDQIVAEHSRRPLPERLQTLPFFQRLDLVGWAFLALLLSLLPSVPGLATQERAFFLTLILTYALVALSLTLLTGWAGQVSLGHFAFLGVGAYTAAHAFHHGWGAPVVLVLAGLVTAATACLVGLPAVRFRGLFLAVSTLAFAFAAQSWLFRQPWVQAGHSGIQSITHVRVPVMGAIRTERGIYYFALLTTLLVIAAVLSLRTTSVGRSLIAVRDNESLAATHGLTPTTIKLLGLALSGFIAGLAGALWGMASANWSYQSFDPTMSLVMLSIAIVGGVVRCSGAVLGAFAVFAWPYLVPGADTLAIRLVSAGLLLMLVLFFLPEGLVSLVDRAKAWAVRTVDRGLPEPLTIKPDQDPLVVDSLSIRFDGPPVLSEVSLRVGDNEIVGIIGSNGAGKTTFLNCISGHLRGQAASIRIAGRDVTGLAPEYRPWLGATRSFQDASLFAGLTVLETVMVALDRTDRSGPVAAAFRAPWVVAAERRKSADARAVLDWVGLSDRADSLVGELSTGMRRLCDLASVIAARPRLVLLDEPAAGLAQREVESLGPVLRQIRDDLGCAIVVVEHDIPLVMSLCDRVYCFEAGRVIAEGTPAQVRNDPAVIASYLGANAAAGQRSGAQARPRLRRSAS
jgi:ABC-type branched-subunit amino acid transport system ATPase component/ABC-type branched-subunit amino acid transport system permease subunit